MKYGRISLLLTAAAMALSAAPSQAAVIVRVGPPVARFERVPVAPAPGYVWRAGYWRWTGARYVWWAAPISLRHIRAPLGFPDIGSAARAAGSGSTVAGVNG